MEAGYYLITLKTKKYSGIDDCPSVVEVLFTTENDKSLECLDIPLLDDLLSSKWNNYFIYYVLFAT